MCASLAPPSPFSPWLSSLQSLSHAQTRTLVCIQSEFNPFIKYLLNNKCVGFQPAEKQIHKEPPKTQSAHQLFWGVLSAVEVLGPGWNPSHSSDNTGSLTHGATGEPVTALLTGPTGAREPRKSRLTRCCWLAPGWTPPPTVTRTHPVTGRGRT